MKQIIIIIKTKRKEEIFWEILSKITLQNISQVLIVMEGE